MTKKNNVAATNIEISIKGSGLKTTQGFLMTDDLANTIQPGKQTSLSTWNFPAVGPGNYVFKCFIYTAANSKLSFAIKSGTPVIQGPQDIALLNGLPNTAVHGAGFDHFTV